MFCKVAVFLQNDKNRMLHKDDKKCNIKLLNILINLQIFPYINQND